MKQKIIPYSRQYIDEDDINAVTKILRQDIITQGSVNTKFEYNFSKKINSKYSVSFNSATSALHASCKALGLGRDSIVWTTSNSFVATSNSALYCGAKVDFVDINRQNWNLDVECLEEKLLKSKKINKLPDVVITVHLGGLPSDQKRIWELSREYDFRIIEDASHSLGASFKKQKVGNCKWSDITVFSFHPVKIITTGEGGMSTTNSQELFEKLELFKSHGITKNTRKFVYKETLEWQYEQQILGYNYRMSDIAAALGISQLKKLEKFVKKRNEIAKIYRTKLKNYPIYFQSIPKDTISSFHLFILRLEKNEIKNRNLFFKYLRKNNIYVNLHYKSIHLHPFYRTIGFKKGLLPETEKYSQDAISIPVFYNLSAADQLKICSLIKKFFG